MRKHDVPAGTLIDSVIAEMIKEANLHNEPVCAEMRGVEIVVQPGSEQAEVLKHFKEKEAELIEHELLEEHNTFQAKADEAFCRLPALDFSDLTALIDFFEEFLDASGVTHVNFDKQAVMDAFVEHGFDRNVNCGSEFDGDDRENYARWIIGQALASMMDGGAFVRVYDNYARDWREKFAPSSATC